MYEAMNPSRMSHRWVQWFCYGRGICYVVTMSSNWLQSPTHCQKTLTRSDIAASGRVESEEDREGRLMMMAVVWLLLHCNKLSSINTSPTMWLPVFYICFDLINLYKFGNQNYIFIINTNNATSFSIIFCPALIIYNYNDRSRLDDKFL